MITSLLCFSQNDVNALTNEDYGYEVLDDGTIRLYNYHGNDKNVIIPEEIDGKKVTVIEIGMFQNCDNVENIETIFIPKTIKEFHNENYDYFGCLSDCLNLKRITVDSNNEYFTSVNGALLNKSKTELLEVPDGLSSFTIPETIEFIGGAFINCKNIKEILIPASVQSLYYNASYSFYGCDSLESILVDSNNKVYSSAYGILYDKNKTTLIKAPKKMSVFKINENIEIIDTDAFRECSYLKEINIPENVTTIRSEAFRDCNNLEKIIIPAKTSNISFFSDADSEYCATFEGCDNLKVIDININNKKYQSNNGIVYEKDSSTLYYAAKGITTANILSGTKIIGGGSFSGCTKLTTVVVPNSVEDIEGRYAFAWCESLKTLTLPSSVKSLGLWTFIASNNLTLSLYDDSPLLKLPDEDWFNSGYRKEVNILPTTKQIATTKIALAAYYNAGSNIKPTVTIKDGSKTLKNGTDYTFTYTKASKVGATVKVTIKGKGNYTGSVTKSVKIAKKPVSKLTITGISSTKTYIGKAIKPTVTVKNGSKTLKKGTDYTVTYGKNKVTGKATVTIKANPKSKYYSGNVTKTFYIVPKAPTSLKLTAGKKSIKVSYKKSTGASGYQIAYSTKKTSGFKYVTTTAVSKTISKLTSKKTYYIKVRAYKTVNGKKYYGPYTSVKSVKTK